jgi:glycosyltransferase involved in cell wall biosynthesis
MKQNISVFIIAFNEEAIISKCLEKLYWASEIIIVDSGSTDNTVAICKKYGAKVIFKPFENFGKQKQFALSQTSNNWVLSLDSDEVLSDKLIEEIQNHTFSDTFSGYSILRTHVFLNKVFKYGSENKKPILRLFDKNRGCFQENKVHEKIIIEGKMGSFKNEMLHYTVFELSIAVRKMINYALLSGEFLFEQGKKTNLFKPFIKFPFEFIRVYWIQLNVLNGYQGFVWSLFSAFGSFIKYAKLLELQENEK